MAILNFKEENIKFNRVNIKDTVESLWLVAFHSGCLIINKIYINMQELNAHSWYQTGRKPFVLLHKKYLKWTIIEMFYVQNLLRYMNKKCVHQILKMIKMKINAILFISLIHFTFIIVSFLLLLSLCLCLSLKICISLTTLKSYLTS